MRRADHAETARCGVAARDEITGDRGEIVEIILPAFAGREPLHWGAWRRNSGALLLAASVFAGLAMTNAWDAVIYGAVWGAAVLAVVSVFNATCNTISKIAASLKPASLTAARSASDT